MIEVFNCEQGSPEWIACRLGIPTASKFATILAKGREGGASKTRKEYLFKLLGERVTGEQMYSYQNDHMERGKQMEDEARNLYSFREDVDCERVGFIRNFGAGCSPDSLIGDKGMLEIKTKLAHLQIEVLVTGNLPSEHTAQLQGQLWVAEREWVDFVSYWPKTPLYVKRIYRDEAYIKDLAKGVEVFLHELATLEGVLEDQKMHRLLRDSIKAARAEAAA
jgi:YqaJ-like recombinase protein